MMNYLLLLIPFICLILMIFFLMRLNTISNIRIMAIEVDYYTYMNETDDISIKEKAKNYELLDRYTLSSMVFSNLDKWKFEDFYPDKIGELNGFENV